jgi:hypothetical protein
MATAWSCTSSVNSTSPAPQPSPLEVRKYNALINPPVLDDMQFLNRRVLSSLNLRTRIVSLHELIKKCDFYNQSSPASANLRAGGYERGDCIGKFSNIRHFRACSLTFVLVRTGRFIGYLLVGSRCARTCANLTVGFERTFP